MRVIWKQGNLTYLVKFLIFLMIFRFVYRDVYNVIHVLHIKTVKYFTYVPRQKDFKAFITSSYYYPKSQSLGDNSLGLIMSLNDEKKPEQWMEMQWWNWVKEPPIRILARNETDSVVVNTSYKRITPHEICKIMNVFATVQLIPNVKSISMMGENGLVEIPFTIPIATKRDVVVCISPLFVSEQWQNFLLATHIYKRFGAHMHLYLISAVKAFYQLMEMYQSHNYLSIQPWVSVKYTGISEDIIDAYNQIEFRNQAGAQCDCLLQFKETANFVTFLDMDDILIPKLEPTYLQEFTYLFSKYGNEHLSFITYPKENHEVTTVRDSLKFSFEKMFRSIKYRSAVSEQNELKNSKNNQKQRETGKIVVNPKKLNYTWIHFPPFMPRGMDRIEVTENVITHLKNIIWKENHIDELSLMSPKYYNNQSEELIGNRDIFEIEADLKRMINKPEILDILGSLPKEHFYSDIIGKCYYEKYYYYHYAGRISEITCPGPHMCEYTQRSDIQCVHVNATYNPMPHLHPISFFFATDPYFTTEIGCYPH